MFFTFTALAEIIAILYRESAKILAEADMKERLAALGYDVVASTPKEFAARIAAEIDRDVGQGDPGSEYQSPVIQALAAGHSISPVELSRCRGIGDRCKVGRSAGMITVRRDAVRTQGRAPKGGRNQRDREAVGSSSRLEARFPSHRGCQIRHFCHS